MDQSGVRMREMEGKVDSVWTDLLDAVGRGEGDAERELVERLYPQVAGRISGMLPRREAVEDLAQEVFLKIFTKLETYRGGCFEAWVDMITRRVCYDALRKRRVRPEWCFAELGENGLEENAVERREPGEVDAAETLATLFKMIPAEQAWLLNEVELAERSIGEVSAEMGWTATAGRLRLMRARRRLKKTYEQWEHEEH